METQFLQEYYAWKVHKIPSLSVEGLREDPYHWTELPSLNKDYYYY